MKTIKLAILLTFCTVLYLFTNNAFSQYKNYERLLGKENPYISFVKGDSVWMFEKTDSTHHLVRKVETQQKILEDIRVINRNQNTLENWLIASIILNLVCIFLVVRLMIRKKSE